jgi:hypothetical protein
VGFLICVATVYPLQGILRENCNFSQYVELYGQNVQVKYKYVETYFIVIRVVAT